tara:strand:+ start:1100 stop:1270 length:171 start_codon:yes stop_codon:yes gene_type:complete
MIKVGSIVRDTHIDKIGIVTRIYNSKTGRGVLGYEVLIDNDYRDVPIGWLEVIYGG